MYSLIFFSPTAVVREILRASNLQVPESLGDQLSWLSFLLGKISSPGSSFIALLTTIYFQ